MHTSCCLLELSVRINKRSTGIAQSLLMKIKCRAAEHIKLQRQHPLPGAPTEAAANSGLFDALTAFAARAASLFQGFSRVLGSTLRRIPFQDILLGAHPLSWGGDLPLPFSSTEA